MFRRMFRLAPRLLLAVLVVWVLLMQAGCFSMRTPDGRWPDKLAERGQRARMEVVRAQSPTGRSVHAVALHVTDSLPVVVGVHGSPGSADAFLDYLADTLLSAHVRFVAVDRAGFGYTAFGRAETSLARQALDIKAVLDVCAPGRKVVLVGHSLGGPLIARFAMDHPDRVAGLVIVAGSVDPDLEPHPWWQEPLDRAPLRWLIPRSFRVSNREIRFLEDELRAMVPLWPGITCPVRVLHATNDRLVPFANVAFLRTHLTGASDLAVDTMRTGDHFILWNHRERVTKAVLDLVGR